ncbi:MAG: beta-ketoacyl synthase chain length factor, partial [Candidatus Omnitrophica bacterium]|nr:beta-ketoacyl synthase chain length factor [Candidatus Omnitrophota bacterium]
MHINGIGIISPVGRGLEVHRQALANASLPAVVDGFHRVSEKDLKDPCLAKDARRAGRFDRIAILAGMDALKDAGICLDIDSPQIGLILATSFGPHSTTFRFLDDLLNFKEKDVSPTLFSHSVHNAAASYLSLLARIQGPTLTVTRFFFAFEEALSLACSWLEQQRCKHVLVGAVDELGSVMEQIIR